MKLQRIWENRDYDIDTVRQISDRFARRALQCVAISQLENDMVRISDQILGLLIGGFLLLILSHPWDYILAGIILLGTFWVLFFGGGIKWKPDKVENKPRIKKKKKHKKPEFR